MGKQARINACYKAKCRNDADFQKAFADIEESFRRWEVLLFDDKLTDDQLEERLFELLAQAQNQQIGVYTSAGQQMTRIRGLELAKIILNYAMTSLGIRHSEDELKRIQDYDRRMGMGVWSAKDRY
jgi:hypothetical protein